MAEPEKRTSETLRRALHLALACVIAMAFVGFFVGLRQGTTVPDLSPPERTVPRAVPDAVPATSYEQFDRRRHGPNRDWRSVLQDLEQVTDDLFAEPRRTEERRRAVLAARMERRAFDGAPPVIPHPVDQTSAASCVACHGEGISIGRGVRAPRMSHAYMPNCLQCHVEQQADELEPFHLAGSTFEGSRPPLGGERAWEGAPPTVPHPILMRENCASCHGPTGPEPIRTTHPWRANCLQCHAPSALLDQTVADLAPRFIFEED